MGQKKPHSSGNKVGGSDPQPHAGVFRLRTQKLQSDVWRPFCWSFGLTAVWRMCHGGADVMCHAFFTQQMCISRHLISIQTASKDAGTHATCEQQALEMLSSICISSISRTTGHTQNIQRPFSTSYFISLFFWTHVRSSPRLARPENHDWPDPRPLQVPRGSSPIDSRVDRSIRHETWHGGRQAMRGGCRVSGLPLISRRVAAQQTACRFPPACGDGGFLVRSISRLDGGCHWAHLTPLVPVWVPSTCRETWEHFIGLVCSHEAVHFRFRISLQALVFAHLWTHSLSRWRMDPHPKCGAPKSAVARTSTVQPGRHPGGFNQRHHTAPPKRPRRCTTDGGVVGGGARRCAPADLRVRSAGGMAESLAELLEVRSGAEPRFNLGGSYSCCLLFRSRGPQHLW